MKVNRTGLLLVFALALVLLLLVIGSYSLLTNKNSNIQTVDVGVNVGVRVMDLVNRSPVNGAHVYFVALCPNNTSSRDVHLSDLTGDDGWALFTVNYTLDKDEAIYLGASNRKPLVESDFAKKKFNGSGYLGEWKSFNYTLLYNNQDNKATIGCTITVDLDSGKMI